MLPRVLCDSADFLTDLDLSFVFSRILQMDRIFLDFVLMPSRILWMEQLSLPLVWNEQISSPLPWTERVC